MQYRKRIDSKAAEALVRLNNVDFNRTKMVIRKMIDNAIVDEINLGKLSLEFTVPRSILGYAPYDLQRMCVNLVKDLTRDGYRVHGTFKKFTILWEDPDSREIKIY